MHSSSKFKFKGQFFILSAFVMVTIFLLLSQFIQPSIVYDTSLIVQADEAFIFNNIKEKSEEIVSISKNCNELRFNLEEYRNFVERFVTQKNIQLTYDFDIRSPCSDSQMITDFAIEMKSPRASAEATFTAQK
jgi:plastocyanin domain-containing protein